jgi:hypothetical protein
MANNTRAIDAPRENRVAGTGEPVVLQDAIGNAMRAYWDCLDRKRDPFHRQRNSGSQVRRASRDDDRGTPDSEPTETNSAR